MEAVVIRCFCDKTAAERFVPVGATYVGTADRIAELAAAGYVEAPVQPEQKPRKRKKGGEADA